MIGLLLALALPVMAQQATPSQSATSSADSTRVDAIDIAVQSLQSGKPHFTSTPTFTSVCFGDGTCQTTAATANSGNFTSDVNVTQSTFTFSTGTYVTYGTPGTNPLNTGDGVVWALWNNTLTQSSGCVVVIYMSDDTPTAHWVAETRAAGPVGLWGFMPAVMVEPSCVLNSYCRFATRGTYRVRADSAGVGSSSFVGMGNAQCRVEGEAANDMSAIGNNASSNTGAVSANAFFWLKLR